MTKTNLRVCQVACVIAVCIGLASASRAQAPQADEVRRIAECLGAEKLEYTADIVREVEKTFKEQGKQGFTSQSSFLDKFPPEKRLDAYNAYVKCIRKEVSIQIQDSPLALKDSKTRCSVASMGGVVTSIVWSGECANGLAQGRGMLRLFRDGKEIGYLAGEFRDGNLEGKGRLNLISAVASYDGEVERGEFEGQGTWTGSGQKYIGSFRDGQFNGLGTMIFSHDWGRYEGGWKDGDFYGKGVFIFDVGNLVRFEGTFDGGRDYGRPIYRDGITIYRDGSRKTGWQLGPVQIFMFMKGELYGRRGS